MNPYTRDAAGRFQPFGEGPASDPSALAYQQAQLFQEMEHHSARVPLHPVVLDIAARIDADPVLRMYLTEMIAQVPEPFRPYHPADVPHLLRHLNAALSMAPEYNHTALVGTPLYSILFWTMGTPAGLAAYTLPAVNAMFEDLLAVWADFLNSGASRYVLNDSERGWQSPAARARLHMEDYQHDPEALFWGFSSYNDFFTRRLVPGARPIDGEDDPKVIVAACDSTVQRVQRRAARTAPFWIKGHPYSLSDMLDGRFVDELEGGDVLQAFLSPFDYHRWHSPVAGTVREAYVKKGLYFSKPPGDVEAYLAHVQTRALIFIEADDPAIGLVAIVPVGMVEVSSCVLGPALQPGTHVEKGQELGLFQLGGSTHCLVFRPGVLRELLAPKGQDWPCANPWSWMVKVGQAIAVAG